MGAEGSVVVVDVVVSGTLVDEVVEEVVGGAFDGPPLSASVVLVVSHGGSGDLEPSASSAETSPPQAASIMHITKRMGALNRTHAARSGNEPAYGPETKIAPPDHASSASSAR